MWIVQHCRICGPDCIPKRVWSDNFGIFSDGDSPWSHFSFQNKYQWKIMLKSIKN